MHRSGRGLIALVAAVLASCSPPQEPQPAQAPATTVRRERSQSPSPAPPQAAERTASAPAPAPHDAAASAAMARVEAAWRSPLLISRISVVAQERGAQVSSLIWSLRRSTAERTALFTIFLLPERRRGLRSLIIDDHVGDAPDRISIHLPGRPRKHRTDATALRLLVPGTAFSYDDIRGWFGQDRYSFTTIAADAGGVLVRCECRPEWRKRLGLSHVEARVDGDMVHAARYFDQFSKPVREYRLEDAVAFAGRVLPERVRFTHLQERFDSSVRFEHWHADADAAVAGAPWGDDDERLAEADEVVAVLDGIEGPVAARLREDLAAADAAAVERATEP
ncbi:MAG TPA: outer membrane lipoprotein-sorting protein [Planctomycetota bacterium]|nr:outer membrane lipoprotein-sorting protein [Planctomycetota bacterium]